MFKMRLLVVVASLAIAGAAVWWIFIRDSSRTAMRSFDRRTGQQPVRQFSQAQKLLNSLPKVSYRDLPASFRRMMDPKKKFESQVNQRHWFRIRGDENFHYIAGPFRLLDVIPHDSLFARNLKHLPDGIDLYFLLDERVIERFIALQSKLRKMGHDPDAFDFYNGYRYPSFNEKEGGASHSRHIWGEALDFHVLDVNRDGTADSLDKALVYQLLDREIIGGRGGIGRYPGTDALHMDVRGHRARWDSY